jgi:hypothetical protein
MKDGPTIIDMTPEGEFTAPPPRGVPILSFKARMLLIALGFSFVLGIVASAALLLPLVAVAAIYGYVALRGPAGRVSGRPSGQDMRRF